MTFELWVTQSLKYDKHLSAVSLPSHMPNFKAIKLHDFNTIRGRVTHIWVIKLTIIGSDNGLSPGRRQAIIWTNAGILLIGPLGTNFIEILIRIQTFSFKKMHLKMSSAKWRPFCLGLNVLKKNPPKHGLSFMSLWSEPLMNPATPPQPGLGTKTD